MNPPDTIQSFCLLTETWKTPELLLMSSGSSDNLEFLIALFLSRYSFINDATLSFLPNLLFLLSKNDFSTPKPMLTLLSPLGNTHPYPPGAIS